MPKARPTQMETAIVKTTTGTSIVASRMRGMLAGPNRPTTPRPARVLQRGARYPMRVTDFVQRGRVWVQLCEIEGLGHAWSGGAPRLPYSDPKGPDASRLILAFALKQWARAAA